MNCGNQWRQRSGRPAEESNERSCKPPPYPANIAADVDTEAQMREREHTEGCREEEREEKKRNSGKLALERTTHGVGGRLTVDGWP